MQSQWHDSKEWCRLKGIKYTRYCSWATRVNRETRQVEQQQWAYVTGPKKIVVIMESSFTTAI